MKPLRVTHIQRGCVYDGPGVRTTVFLKGCPLRCPWCCNPETQQFEEEWFVDNEKCLKNRGVPSMLCANCVRCGGKETEYSCPFGVAEKTSNDYEMNELLGILLKDLSLFSQTNGGVTFSGGEPLLFSESISPLIVSLKKSGVSIAIETSLTSPLDNILMLLPYVNCWIVDLKLQPQMLLYDLNYLNRMEIILDVLREKYVLYRLVFVDRMLDEAKTIIDCLIKLGVESVELLSCHDLGEKKYLKLSRDFCSYSADRTKAIEFVKIINNNGINSLLLEI